LRNTSCVGKTAHVIGKEPGFVEVINVGKRFGMGTRVLEALTDLDLIIPAGDFVTIIGQSGCGKTTLLRLIAGLDHPSEGQIKVGGKLVQGTGWDRGMIFQEPRLFPWATVAHNVDLGLPDRGQDQQADQDRVMALLRLVGLEDFATAYPGELSGGMAQRVALARALAGSPKVLLLDEPLGALDAVTRMRMQNELLRIWQTRALTMVAVTHDLDEAILLSTQIVVLSERPGTVRRVIPVDLPYPRDRTTLEFNVFRQELVGMLA
jgi:sulfonate transport system ATP-binding protein